MNGTCNAFTIRRGKLKAVHVFLTREQAVLALAGKVGFVVVSDQIYKVKSVYEDTHHQHLRVLGPADSVAKQFYTREVYPTAKAAWAARNAELRTELAERLGQVKALRDELKRKPVKGSVFK